MDPSYIRVLSPSPPSSPSTSTPSAVYRFTAASSSVASVSTVIPSHVSSYYFSSSISSTYYSSFLLRVVLSLRFFPMAWVDTSIPASRPVHI